MHNKFGVHQSDHSIEDLEVRGIKKIHNNSTQWRRERERELLDFHIKNSGAGQDELRRIVVMFGIRTSENSYDVTNSMRSICKYKVKYIACLMSWSIADN